MSGSGFNRNGYLAFTTTQVGKICGASQQAVIKWIDSGRLKGYRLPHSRARRVTRDSLLAFMRENNIPPDVLEEVEKVRVLVVDDEKIVADMVEEEFACEANVEVKKVYRGFDAGVVADYKPDVVVLDVMLPDVDGRVVCDLIRSGKGGRDIRIIGISGYLSPEEAERMPEMGFDDFIPKPFSPGRIREAILALVSREG